MNKTLNILERILLIQKDITPKQQKLAAYILDHYKKAAFLNSTDLAKAANVSGSTVIRFAELLEYSGFPEMQSALHNLVQLELNALDMFSDPYEKEDPNDLDNIFQYGANHIIKATKNISIEAFNESVELINRQKKVLIIAHQISTSLAEYTNYALGKIRPNVSKLTNWSESTFNVLDNFTTEDVAIIYAFPRFPYQTYETAKFLHSKQVPIIYITENGINPISEFATISIPLRTKFASYVDDLGPAMYLAKALILTIANTKRDQTASQLEKFENHAKTFKIFCTQNT